MTKAEALGNAITTLYVAATQEANNGRSGNADRLATAARTLQALVDAAHE